MAKKEHKTSIGGSAVMEGVMMRGPEAVAVAVRKPDGEITLDVKKTKSVKKRNWILKGFLPDGCTIM